MPLAVSKGVAHSATVVYKAVFFILFFTSAKVQQSFIVYSLFSTFLFVYTFVYYISILLSLTLNIFRQESQSPVLEGIPSPLLLKKVHEFDCDSEQKVTLSEDSASTKKPEAPSSSLGKIAKDVLSRQGSNASERINGASMIYLVLLCWTLFCCSRYIA